MIPGGETETLSSMLWDEMNCSFLHDKSRVSGGRDTYVHKYSICVTKTISVYLTVPDFFKKNLYSKAFAV